MLHCKIKCSNNSVDKGLKDAQWDAQMMKLIKD